MHELGQDYVKKYYCGYVFEESLRLEYGKKKKKRLILCDIEPLNYIKIITPFLLKRKVGVRVVNCV